MLLELFPFIILNNDMAFVNMIFFSDFLHYDMSFIIDCYPAGVSNKHCLLSLFSFLSANSIKVNSKS